MIKELKRVRTMYHNGIEIWLYPVVGLVGIRHEIKAGNTKIIYVKNQSQFIADGAGDNGVIPLRSATIMPIGEALIHCDALDEPSPWSGSLDPISYGVHINANCSVEAIEDSVIHCISPRDNLKGFEGRDAIRQFIGSGESIIFNEDDIGFVVVWGKDMFHSFSVDADDEYEVDEDTVIVRVKKVEAENEV